MGKANIKPLFHGLRVLTIPQELADDPTVRRMATMGLDLEHTAVLVHPAWWEGQGGRFLLTPKGELHWLDGAFEPAMGLAEREGFHFMKPVTMNKELLVRLNGDGTADLYRRLYT